MAQLGDWSIEVSVPAHVSNDDAHSVVRAVTAELQRWAADTYERLSRDFGIDISISVHGE